MDAAVLAVEGLCMSFGPVQVLFDISLGLRRGEVHAIIGENGAGKSTLMKLMAGFLQPTAGRIRLDGQPATIPGGGAAERLGIVLIHQEMNLAEHLTVEENIFLGRELRRGLFLDKGAMRALARGYLADLDSALDPDARIAGLSVSDKQMVEIAKAVAREARILIMDEPTAVLTPHETAVLFRLIRRLRGQGVTIVYISHKLDEVKAIADRVTVLRDGRLIGTHDAAELSTDDMARMMVGRELADMFPTKAPPREGPPALEVEGLSVPGLVEGVSFAVRRGEVLGFAGLIGAGRTELFEALVGLRPRSAGRIRRDGRELRIDSPKDAARAGIAYLTEDRKGKGLLLAMGLRPNLTLLALSKYSGRAFIDQAAEAAALDRAVKRFDIRAARPEVPVGKLSGGNQQKLLLAKVMEIEPEVVIVDEPTRGIDIGTKRQIYHFIGELAAQGRAVVVISSEMPEVIGLSHRIVVMRSGRAAGCLEGADLHEGEIVRYATGLKGAA
ncbi:MAG TPA: sugar ABC transporter ATP-binding protein [Alphaproteobacteria bacterium]|nr:sugar ABC transporter ATP-binding protein [Alphaproteobacteria bacterium]